MGAAALKDVVDRYRKHNDKLADRLGIEERRPAVDLARDHFHIAVARLTPADRESYFDAEGNASPHVADLICASLDYVAVLEAEQASRTKGGAT